MRNVEDIPVLKCPSVSPVSRPRPVGRSTFPSEDSEEVAWERMAINLVRGARRSSVKFHDDAAEIWHKIHHFCPSPKPKTLNSRLQNKCSALYRVGRLLRYAEDDMLRSDRQWTK